MRSLMFLTLWSCASSSNPDQEDTAQVQEEATEDVDLTPDAAEQAAFDAWWLDTYCELILRCYDSLASAPHVQDMATCRTHFGPLLQEEVACVFDPVEADECVDAVQGLQLECPGAGSVFNVYPDVCVFDVYDCPAKATGAR